MKIALDTSALAKRYIQEPGSEELDSFFISVTTIIYVSTLALPEFATALGRKVRDKEISKRSAASALEEFDRDWQGLFTRVPLDDMIASSAAALGIKYPVKGADAVHLASAIEMGVDLFVASDHKLLKLAEKEGLKAYDPATGAFSAL